MDEVIYKERQSDRAIALESLPHNGALHSSVHTANSRDSVGLAWERPESPIELRWPLSSTPSELHEREVHVWSFCLDVSPACLARFESCLSMDERERASRFHFEQHRNRYVAGRGWLRELLSAYVDVSPEKISFDYGPHGKPALSGQSAQAGIEFNLSHSDSIALAGVTRAGPLGLDIECVKALADMDELVKRFFSKRESLLFKQLKREEQLAGFFNLWTRKEAWLKATGQGISQYLNRVEVSFLPGQTARLLELPEGFTPAHQWSLYDLDPGYGLKGALAIPVTDARISRWQWCDNSKPIGN
jgi:4'-phosphopantetheinyl transferase